MAYQHLSFVDYRDHYYEQDNHLLLDVRTSREYQQSHVPGAINIPLDQLEGRLSEVPEDEAVVVICASGNRSQTGAALLKEAGRQAVFNLQGGTMVWMMNGLPLEQ